MGRGNSFHCRRRMLLRSGRASRAHHHAAHSAAFGRGAGGPGDPQRGPHHGDGAQGHVGLAKGRSNMDVLMPQLGETVAEGKIRTWFKSVGDKVAPGDNLFEIETDKVTMEVPSISAGVLAEIRVPEGEIAPV